MNGVFFIQKHLTIQYSITIYWLLDLATFQFVELKKRIGPLILAGQSDFIPVALGGAAAACALLYRNFLRNVGPTCDACHRLQDQPRLINLSERVATVM